MVTFTPWLAQGFCHITGFFCHNSDRQSIDLLLPKMELALDELGACGRGNQLRQVKTAFRRKIDDPTKVSESAILVEGESGTGKSLFVHEFLDECQRTGSCW